MATTTFGGRNQPAHDLLAFRGHGVEGEAALVAVHLQEQRALAGLGHGRLEAVLAPLALLDADHIGAVLGKEGRTVRARDVAPEIEHPDAFQNSRHVPSDLA